MRAIETSSIETTQLISPSQTSTTNDSSDTQDLMNVEEKIWDDDQRGLTVQPLQQILEERHDSSEAQSSESTDP